MGATWLGVLLAYDSSYWGSGHDGLPVSFFIVSLIFLAYLVSGARPSPPHSGVGARPIHPPVPTSRVGRPPSAEGTAAAMFSGFMTNAWIVATIVAVIAGVVGFFVVLRGAAFPAHAIPNGAFAGAAGAALLGVNALVGLGVFAVLAALGIGRLGRRGRHDVVTALALVMMLALGAAFLSHTTEYAPEIFALLFGEVLGVSATEILPVVGLAVACLAAVARALPPTPARRRSCPRSPKPGACGPTAWRWASSCVLALATAMTVPVVGALLIFSLMIGPPAAARSFTSRPPLAIGLVGRHGP